MNARVPGPSAAGRAGNPALTTAAAELLAAGEGLVRAAGALAELARRSTRSPPTSPETRPRSTLPVGERLSSKQLGAIRAMSRRAGLSRDGLVQLLDEITGKEEPSDLSRGEASLVLDKLSALTGYAR